MNETTRQQTTPGDVATRPEQHDGEGSQLADARAETDRLFAVASESFAAMAESNSQEFLRRSRQTGGQ